MIGRTRLMAAHVAGNVLDPEHASFVGLFPIPTRHGMTSGELARLFNEPFGIGCDLEVVHDGRLVARLWLDDTDAPWVLPSPNMPTLDSATVFPGHCSLRRHADVRREGDDAALRTDRRALY